MNREERIYSVTMTEDELRLFSEFLEQKEFGGRENEDSFLSRGPYKMPTEPIDEDSFLSRGPHRPDTPSKRRIPDKRRIPEQLKGDKDGAKKVLEDARKKVKGLTDSLDFVHNNHKDKSAIHKLSGHQRMSKRFIKDKNPEFQELYKTENRVKGMDPKTWTQENINHDAELEAKKAAAHIRTGNILFNEEKLAESGYDKKYAAKGLERILGKRISGDEAEAIVNNRLNMDKNYRANSHDTDGIREVGTRLGRRWDDAKMVYGEALDGRSLGKDAAMAAGGLAAAGLAVHAIRKHKKKKQAQKEALSNKFRTSEE